MATDSRFLKVDGAFQRPIPWNALSITPPQTQSGGFGMPALTPSPSSRFLDTGTTQPAGGGSPLPSNQPTQSAPPAQTGGGTSPAPSSDPMGAFNTLMLTLLKSAQGVNTADLLKRKRELEREASARTAAPTEEKLRTLSPAQQDAIRSGNVSALSPEIDANAYELEKAQQSIDSFFKVQDAAQKMSQEFADKMVAPDSVIANAQKIIQANPDSLSTVLSSFNDKSKQKVLEGLDYAAMAATTAAQKKSSGSTGSNQMTDNERALMGQFRGEPIVKDYNTMLQKKLSVEGIVKSGVGGPGDLALVFEFMKALDPNSVVRETEYATAAKSGNIFAGAFARFNGYLKENGGFLPPQVQQAFLSLINTKFGVQQKLYDNTVESYKSIATRQGLNPDNVIINYSGAAPGPSYAPGTIIENGGKNYIVGDDGETLTPVTQESSSNIDWTKFKKL